MTTKERILAKSLELFNLHGLKEVTLRRIAKALGMSQGNLNYHFKTKGEIVSALYFELVAKMDAEMQAVAQEQPVMSFLYQSSYATMSGLYAYRFILKDLYKVLQMDTQLRTHYLALQQVREAQYLQLFQAMSEGNLIRPEEFEGEYKRLHERMNILGDNWINAAELFRPGEASAVAHYCDLLFEVIYPYLTEEGKRQYWKLVEER